MPIRRRALQLQAALTLLLGIAAHSASAASYYVATTGDDASGDGSAATPWATLSKAVASVPAAGGDTILLKPGTYNGRTVTYRSFAARLTIRSELPYRAKLTNIAAGVGNEVLSIFTVGSANITIDGFIIMNLVPGYVPTTRDNVLIHFQDASDLTLQNCIIHDNAAPGCGNELLKINRGSDTVYPRGIVIRGNVFYDRPSVPGADLIDSVRPGELDIAENIFFERDTSDNSQSFITIKRQVNAIPPGALPVRSPRHRVRSNVFLGWDGRSDQAFVQFGEDADAEVMISDSLIENNLMIGDSAHPCSAAVQLKGTSGITVRANTVVGNLPGSSFAARIGTEAGNVQSRDFGFFNNIWSDPTGTMGDRLITTYGDVVVASIHLDRNLFWNNGAALPGSGSVLPTADAHRIVADPQVAGDHTSVAPPVWDEVGGHFPSGSTTIRQEFVRLVTTYGAIGASSPAHDAADPATMPADDILGRPRDAHPDIGCFEYIAAAGNVPPSVAIVTPAAGAHAAPGSIAIAVDAADSDGAVAKVEFFRDGALIGSDTTAPYAMTWSGVSAGSFVLTAKATDDHGATTTSAPVTITVAVGGGPAGGTGGGHSSSRCGLGSSLAIMLAFSVWGLRPITR